MAMAPLHPNATLWPIHNIKDFQSLLLFVSTLMTSEGHSNCYFHPKQLVVGVCAFCLNDRLLILASKQPHFIQPPKPNATLSNILRFLTGRLQFRHPNPENSDHQASPCHEEWFITIKLERNGVGSWEKSKDSKVSVETSWNHDTHRKEGSETETRGVIEHGKPHASLRWRKRIGHLFQVMRWWKKRPNKSGTGRRSEGEERMDKEPDKEEDGNANYKGRKEERK